MGSLSPVVVVLDSPSCASIALAWWKYLVQLSPLVIPTSSSSSSSSTPIAVPSSSVAAAMDPGLVLLLETVSIPLLESYDQDVPLAASAEAEGPHRSRMPASSSSLPTNPPDGPDAASLLPALSMRESAVWVLAWYCQSLLVPPSLPPLSSAALSASFPTTGWQFHLRPRSSAWSFPRARLPHENVPLAAAKTLLLLLSPPTSPSSLSLVVLEAVCGMLELVAQRLRWIQEQTEESEAIPATVPGGAVRYAKGIDVFTGEIGALLFSAAWIGNCRRVQRCLWMDAEDSCSHAAPPPPPRSPDGRMGKDETPQKREEGAQRAAIPPPFSFPAVPSSSSSSAPPPHRGHRPRRYRLARLLLHMTTNTSAWLAAAAMPSVLQHVALPLYTLPNISQLALSRLPFHHLLWDRLLSWVYNTDFSLLHLFLFDSFSFSPSRPRLGHLSDAAPSRPLSFPSLMASLLSTSTRPPHPHRPCREEEGKAARSSHHLLSFASLSQCLTTAFASIFADFLWPCVFACFPSSSLTSRPASPSPSSSSSSSSSPMWHTFVSCWYRSLLLPSWHAWGHSSSSSSPAHPSGVEVDAQRLLPRGTTIPVLYAALVFLRAILGLPSSSSPHWNAWFISPEEEEEEEEEKEEEKEEKEENHAWEASCSVSCPAVSTAAATPTAPPSWHLEAVKQLEQSSTWKLSSFPLYVSSSSGEAVEVLPFFVEQWACLCSRQARSTPRRGGGGAGEAGGGEEEGWGGPEGGGVREESSMTGSSPHAASAVVSAAPSFPFVHVLSYVSLLHHAFQAAERRPSRSPTPGGHEQKERVRHRPHHHRHRRLSSTPFASSFSSLLSSFRTPPLDLLNVVPSVWEALSPVLCFPFLRCYHLCRIASKTKRIQSKTNPSSSLPHRRGVRSGDEEEEEEVEYWWPVASVPLLSSNSFLIESVMVTLVESLRRVRTAWKRAMKLHRRASSPLSVARAEEEEKEKEKERKAIAERRKPVSNGLSPPPPSASATLVDPKWLPLDALSSVLTQCLQVLHRVLYRVLDMWMDASTTLENALSLPQRRKKRMNPPNGTGSHDAEAEEEEEHEGEEEEDAQVEEEKEEEEDSWSSTASTPVKRKTSGDGEGEGEGEGAPAPPLSLPVLPPSRLPPPPSLLETSLLTLTSSPSFSTARDATKDGDDSQTNPSDPAAAAAPPKKEKTTTTTTVHVTALHPLVSLVCSSLLEVAGEVEAEVFETLLPTLPPSSAYASDSSPLVHRPSIEEGGKETRNGCRPSFLPLWRAWLRLWQFLQHWKYCYRPPTSSTATTPTTANGTWRLSEGGRDEPDRRVWPSSDVLSAFVSSICGVDGAEERMKKQEAIGRVEQYLKEEAEEKTAPSPERKRGNPP